MPTKPASNNGGKLQDFSFKAPTAGSVQLVGDFTDWQERPISLKKDARGVWRTTVKLGTGAHSYRFLVDGQWQDDPECTLRVPNPYASHDSIRQVA